MKVVAFNGSPRRGGNTEQLIRTVFEPLEEAGIDTELIKVGGRAVRGCTACGKCRENRDGRCVLDGDPVNEWIAEMFAADAVILASPTYFTDVSAELKALIDRAGYVALAMNYALRRKPGAAVVAVRRGGATHAFDTMNHFFQINQMVIPCGTYWNMGYGREPGEVAGDEEGLRNMRVLGENLAWLLGCIHGGGAAG